MKSVVPAAWAVENTMFRALAVLRFVVLGNAIMLTYLHQADYAHSSAAGLVFIVLGVWSVVSSLLYRIPRYRQLLWMVIDLAVAVGAIAVTPWVKGDFNATLPGFWVMVPVLGWAIRYGWRGGLFASLAVSATDISIRSSIDQTNYGNIFLLCLGGPIVGFLSALLKDMANQRERAERAAASAAERARLARVVHDGVLQVLALVQRRGAELGGEMTELGELAGEQEVALRSLVQREDPSYGADLGADRDLAALVTALERRTTPMVSVSVPGGEVPMSAPVAEEIIAVVRACLHNVSDHVGATAPAWVFLEDLGDAVQVSVRDEGPGIQEGRLDAARAEGRLGVSESIQGRIAGLGGTAALHSGPGQGTEWEFTIPRPTRPRLSRPGTRRETRREARRDELRAGVGDNRRR